VVSRDVQFEGRDFKRTLNSRDSIEEVPETRIDVSEGAQPQVSNTPVLGMTGSPYTTSGSQLQGVQGEGAEASGYQSVGIRYEAETLGQGDITSPLVTSEKRKPRWFQQTLKEAKENVGEPKRHFRESRTPERLGCYLAMVTSIANAEPKTFAQAIDQQVWQEAMLEEYDSIMCNDVWEVVSRPEGKSVVTSRWFYKTKYVADGSIEKHKARFVACRFSQVKGVDYDETFAPVARYTSIRNIISIAAEMGWRIHQMNVKTSFLNGFIEEEVYIEQPQGFEVCERESHVCIMRSNLLKLGIHALTHIYFRWDWRRAMLILTYLTSLEVRTCSFSFYMWMTCSSRERSISYLSASEVLHQSLR
jgi:hypothetical protein